MKLIELKCKNCNGTMTANADLDKVTCNYCGTTLLINDGNMTPIERVIKRIGKEIEKSRIYKSSEEYNKKLEVERKDIEEKNKMLIKYMFILLIFFLLFMIVFVILTNN